ncbi:MAG TPA: biotin--[acetyl-CoA-carboxylase] ligase [Chitinophagaceae bacterium]|nr:biotin--[acetyl-CoA-carboxylase] ligase [Chitinophagaceae bacterium]
MPLQFAGNPIGTPFIELQSIDSTNKYAMGLIHQHQLTEGQNEPQHGMVIFTHDQTAGKGQRGKTWTSEKASNIALSVLLNPFPLRVSDQFKLSVFAAVSVHHFFSSFAGNETKIKWPNDLYWCDRKAGGVLIENVVRSSQSAVGSQKPAIANWHWAVIGVGININQTVFPADLPNPVSLKQITGKTYEPLELARGLCNILDKNYRLLPEKNFEDLFNYYQEHLYKKDKMVKLKKGSRVFETTIRGVSETGQLITQQSIEERFEFGEIEWLI